MKKSFFALTMAIAVGFIAAVGLCVRALNGASTVAAFDEGLRIVVDAGHGGIDGGVVGKQTGVKESDLNLAIAFTLNDVLTDMGFEVTMTRKTEAGLYDTTAKGFKKRDMQRRKEIIQRARPDFVFSIHQNFYPSGGTRGGQVFYNAADEDGERLALLMQEKLNSLYANEGAKGRNAAKGEFFMLDCWDCPSVLVECGFLSSAADEKLLCTEIWQRKLAETLAAGLVSYLSGNVA